MLKGILRNLILSILLLSTTHPIYAGNDYFWLLQEYGIEKRAMSNGALIQDFAPLIKPLAFSVKPKQGGIWAIADGYLISFDNEGNMSNSIQLQNINQNAYLISMPEQGAWLFHGDNRYSYDDQLNLTNTLDLPTKGQQINDVAYDYKSKKTWITTTNRVVSIDDEKTVTYFELKKNEKLSGITISTDGEAALIVATPHPEFRLYSKEFELITSHELNNITPAPENIEQTKGGRYWIAGKQHVLLLDVERGIEVNYEYTGLLEQGPGEAQLVTDDNDNSAWVAIGRNLLHIDILGNALQVREEETKKIDAQKEPNISHPPVISPQEQVVDVLPPPQFSAVGIIPNSGSTFPAPNLDGEILPNLNSPVRYAYNPETWFNEQAYLNYPFTIEVSDKDNDIVLPSLFITADQKPIDTRGTFPMFFTKPQTSQREPYNFYSPYFYTGYLNRGSQPYVLCNHIVRAYMPPNTITCVYRQPQNVIAIQSDDEVVPLNLTIRDQEGNSSNSASAIIQIDRTPPKPNRELISLSIQGSTATIAGLAGSSEPGSIIHITNGITGGATVPVSYAEEDGSFIMTIPVRYEKRLSSTAPGVYIGDTINLTYYDASGNASQPITLDVGYLIDVQITSHAMGERVGSSFTVSGTYDAASIDQLTVRTGDYVKESTFDNGTFRTQTITYSPLHPYDGYNESTVQALTVTAEVIKYDGGYGNDIKIVELDLYPPRSVTVDNFETSTTDGVTTLKCSDSSSGCSESGSIVYIVNMRTGATITIVADENGYFTAILPDHNNDSYILYAKDQVGNTGYATILDKTPPIIDESQSTICFSVTSGVSAYKLCGDATDAPIYNQTYSVTEDGTLTSCYNITNGITFCDAVFRQITEQHLKVHITNITSGVTDTVYAGGYTYDSTGELIKTDRFSAPLNGSDTDSYNYYAEDAAGNRSDTYLLDRTPPVINEDLISLSISGTTATLTGLPGSIVDGDTLYILRDSYPHTYKDYGLSNTLNPDGSFTLTFTVTYDTKKQGLPSEYLIGDSIRLHSLDSNDNRASSSAYSVGYKLDFNVTSHTDEQLIGPSFTIKGTHAGSSTPTFTVDNRALNEFYRISTKHEYEPWKSMTFLADADTFHGSLIDIPLGSAYLSDKDSYKPYYIPIKAATNDGGYGAAAITLHVDAYPPEKPSIYYPYVSYNGEQVTIKCNENYAPCAESGATLHATNTINGETAQASADDNGIFTLITSCKRGDRFVFYVEDRVGNKSTTFTTNVGQTYNLSVRANALSDNSIYRVVIDIEPGTIVEFPRTLTVNGVVAFEHNYNTYIADDVPIKPDGTITAIYQDPYGGYGEATRVYDITAPPPPVKELISITNNSRNYYTLTGVSGSVEPNTKVSILNLSTGYLFQTNASTTGSFNAYFTAGWRETLRIYSTDSNNNVGEAIEMPTGYNIDVTITYPEDGSEFQADPMYIAKYIKGYHAGPEGSVVGFSGGGTPAIEGNNFSGIAYADTTYVTNNTYNFTAYVRGPNNGWGSDTISLTLAVQQPNKDLISLAYGDETVTLTGDRNTVFFDSIFTVFNTRTGVVKTYRANNDGSFSVTFPAEKGDTLTLIALDESFNESKPTLLELGYVVDLFITSPEHGAEISGETITVSGTHTGPATSTITVNGIPALINGSEFTASNVSVDESGVIEVRLDDSDGAYGASSITTTRDTTPPAIPNLDLIDTTFSAANHVRLVGQPGSVEAGATLTITNTAQNESKTLTVADDGSFSTYIPGLAGETLTLVAADAVGNQSDSATLQLGTEAMITIESPLQGSTVPALQLDGSNSLTGLVTVTGSHAGPVNSGIVVNGVIAAVTADRFVALNVPVSTDGTLTAKLTALDGSNGSNQISVGLLEQPHLLSLTPSSTEGVAPHSVSFKWNAYTTETPGEVSIDYDGDGTFDQTSSDLTVPLQHDYTAAGINNVTLRITMADGTQYTSETMVVTQGADHYDAIFLSLWDGMNGALLAGEPLVALNYLERRAQGQFHNTFHVIAPRMQTIIDSYRTPARSEVNDYFLEYIVPRASADGNKLYYVYSVRTSDGTWRIKEM